MIPNKETNHVYFSALLKDRYSKEWGRIEAILKKHKVSYSLLKGTKDIWVRDFMPIQVNENELLSFRYEPSYLSKRKDLKSDPKTVCELNRISTKFSVLNLDGGNVVQWKNKAIVTSRIFRENPKRNFTSIKRDLGDLLNAEIIIAPDLKEDMTGHVDGHLRFVNKDTLLVNELKHEDRKWVKGFKEMARKHNFNYIEMPWFQTADEESAIGVYVNYLEIGNLIVFPIFEVKGNRDQEALEVIRQVFPNRKIEPININKIAKEGGLLNCVSWQIKRAL